MIRIGIRVLWLNMYSVRAGKTVRLFFGYDDAITANDSVNRSTYCHLSDAVTVFR
jgi:hypothetical protein